MNQSSIMNANINWHTFATKSQLLQYNRVLVLQYYFTSIDLKHRIHGINQYSEMDVNYKQYSTSILSYNFEN